MNTMHVFYAPDIKTNPCLDEEESRHAVKVLRLTEGSDVVVFDGKGGIFEATIAQANPKHCLLNSIVERQEEPIRDYTLHIAVAPTKNIDRYEWFVEKAAEIGVDRITPLICDFSERKVIKTERLRKILVSAMKQSLQPQLVRIDEATGFKDFIKECACSKATKLIAHCHEGEKKHIGKAMSGSKNFIVMIGPEGDFSEEEVTLASQNGFMPITLGQARLRVETAALYCCFAASFSV